MPCYLFTVIPAPYFRRFAKNTSLKAIVDSVTAAATGALAGARFVLGRRALIDVPTVLIALVTLRPLIKVKKLNEPLLIAGASVLGLAITSLSAP